MASPALAHLAAAGLLVLAGLGWVAVDADADGLATYQEFSAGTRPWDGDTDGDALADGWEVRTGLDPRSPDPDGDGVRDWSEVTSGTDPWSPDSDGDGLRDGQETGDDCDADGLRAGADGDDDADARLDSLEPLAQRCRRDTDSDGVLDGHEGARSCVVRPDCDGDGLADALEAPADLSPLDADTYDVGLPDSVSYAFAQQGQAAGGDNDADGIPDPWEGSAGTIEWGNLAPTVGQRDLLVEFIRAEGPQSGRFDLDFTSTYQAVANTFAAAPLPIRMTWTETRVALDAEAVPPLLPSIDDPYYAELLQQGRHSGNPFVTTVVLNPQHDQSEVAHAGVAPIRGMLAAVDYGQSAVFTFSNANGSRLQLTPFIEELIHAFAAEPTTASQSILLDTGYDSAGVGPGTRLNLHRPASGTTPAYTLRWVPTWFSSALTVDFDGSTPDQTLQIESVQVAHASLAHTILHELGHTLGLCHAHEPDCTTVSSSDRLRQAQSSMSYDSPDGTLHFLPSEWRTVRDYLTCPPVEPVTLLAQDAGEAALLEAKYAFDLDDIESVDARACRDFPEIALEFQANDPQPRTYVAPADRAAPQQGRDYTFVNAGALAVAFLAALALDLVLWRKWHRQRTPPGPDLF